MNAQPSSPPHQPASEARGGHSGPSAVARAIDLADFQQLIRNMYFEKDQARGIDGTFMWLMEEVGELAAADASQERIMRMILNG